jgi:hypothetical protein
MQSPKRCVFKNKQDDVLDENKTMDNVQKRNIYTVIMCLMYMKKIVIPPETILVLKTSFLSVSVIGLMHMCTNSFGIFFRSSQKLEYISQNNVSHMGNLVMCDLKIKYHKSTSAEHKATRGEERLPRNLSTKYYLCGSNVHGQYILTAMIVRLRCSGLRHCSLIGGFFPWPCVSIVFPTYLCKQTDFPST